MIRVVRACCFAALLIGFATGSARADGDTILLLPLDAPARLEAFGQPVAAEIARALGADKLDVVVGTKTSMPDSAKLIVDGSLIPKGEQVVLHLRIRIAADGTTAKHAGTNTDEIVEETAANLVAIAQASTQLSAKLLPHVREQLEVINKAATKPPDRSPPPRPVAPDPILLVGIGVPAGASTMINPLRLALTEAVGTWARTAKRAPTAVDASVLGKQLATQTVASAHAERGIVFEILDYEIIPLAIPLATARVRVRIADASSVVFDRVIATDSVVGDRKMNGEQLAARVAREVLTILKPHMKRVEPTWR